MLMTREEKRTQAFAHAVCAIFTICAILPFILLVIASFTDNAWASANGFSYLPAKWSLEAYKYISLQWQTIGRSYLMTIIVTVLGTSLALFISATFAYAISQSHIPGMKALNFMLIITMLFSGGIVSSYYCYVRLFGLKDTIWGLVIPNMLMNAFYVVLIRNYFTNSIPASLLESARIDGASEYHIFLRIVIPLSKPIIATVGLMTALGFWNDWVNGMYYLTDRGGSRYFTIQIVLNKINENIQTLKLNAGELAKMGTHIDVKAMPSTTVRMAIAVVGILPILIAYPFFQQYFVKGITMGAVKE